MKINKHKASVSMALTNILLSYVDKIGIDSHALCSSVGIEISRLKDLDDRIGYKRFGALWEAAVQQSEDPNFGLHSMMDAVNTHHAGHVLFSLTLNSPTVEKAFLNFFQYHDLMNDVVKPKMIVKNNVVELITDLFEDSIKLPGHIADALLYLYLYMASYLTQDRIKLIEVHFAHKKPSDITEHQKIFQAPLLFEQPKNKLIVEKRFFSRPLFWANSELLETLEQYAKASMEKLQPEKPWTGKTITLINQEMAKGMKISLRLISTKIGLSPRNLQNRLKEEDNTFQKIFNNVRTTIACNYLKKEGAGILDIACMLGFSEQSAFNHAFKRWTGITPREYIRKFY